MTTQKQPEELARLRVLLGKLETGTTSHFDENEKGQPLRRAGSRQGSSIWDGSEKGTPP